MWGVGMGFVPLNTVVPFLLRSLGADEVLIGSLSTAAMLMSALPQLAAAYIAARLSRKVGFFILVHYPACLSVFGMGALAYYADAVGHELASWLIVGCVATFGLAMGMATPLWVHIMAKLLPERVRNTIWSWILCAGTAAGLIGAWQSHRILGESPSLAGYAVCLTLGGVLITLGIQAFWLVREPEEELEPPKRSLLEFARHHLGVVWSSPDMRRLIPLRMLSVGAAAMTGAFLAAAGRDQFNLPDDHAAVFTAAAISSQILHGLWSGPVGDRLGNKVVVVLSPCLVCGAALLALVAPAPGYYAAAFVLVGGLWILEVIAVNGLVMSYCPAADNTPAIAAAATCVMPVAAFAPVLGGWLARTTVGYDVVFAVSAGLSATAAVLMGLLLRSPTPNSRTGDDKREAA
jgi:MFS family permease